MEPARPRPWVRQRPWTWTESQTLVWPPVPTYETGLMSPTSEDPGGCHTEQCTQEPAVDVDTGGRDSPAGKGSPDRSQVPAPRPTHIHSRSGPCRVAEGRRGPWSWPAPRWGRLVPEQLAGPSPRAVSLRVPSRPVPAIDTPQASCSHARRQHLLPEDSGWMSSRSVHGRHLVPNLRSQGGRTQEWGPVWVLGVSLPSSDGAHGPV